MKTDRTKTFKASVSKITADADDTLVKWSSSDENFATVSPTGVIRYKGTGEAVITATLRNGKSKDILFTVIDDTLLGPDAIFPDKEVMEMQPGEQDYFTIRTEPEKSQIDFFTYESEDESVATVDDFGIITAVDPGETRILVTTFTYRVPEQAYVTVIVSEKEEPVEPAEYLIVSGEKSTWKRGSSEGTTITVKRSIEDESCFAHFTGVKIDGKELKEGNDYTAKQGSTIVTILPAALEKLSDGSHEISILFDDGSAVAKLTVTSENAPAGGDETPATGDTMHAAIWLILLILAGLALALIIKDRKKEDL